MKPALLLFFLLLGCGRPRIVAPELQQYVGTLEQAARQYNTSLNTGDVIFELSDQSVLGDGIGASCTSGQGDEKVVRVEKTYWATTSAADHEALMMHELGHCLLGRQHRPGYDYDNQRYLSVMNPSPIGGAEFSQHRDYYLRELLTFDQGQGQQITPAGS